MYPFFPHCFLLANSEWLINNVFVKHSLKKRNQSLPALLCSSLFCLSLSLEFDVLPEQLHQLPLTPSPVPGHSLPHLSQDTCNPKAEQINHGPDSQNILKKKFLLNCHFLIIFELKKKVKNILYSQTFFLRIFLSFFLRLFLRQNLRKIQILEKNLLKNHLK